MKALHRINFLAAIVFLSACTAKTGFEPYQVHGAVEADGARRYQVSDVALALSGAEATERYPDEAALQSAFAGYLDEFLGARDLRGDGYQLAVSVDWERRMIGGEQRKDNFSSAGCRFDSRILKDDKLLASDQGDPLNADSAKYNNKNILNNLKRIGESLTRSGDPESEQRELKRCAKLLVERLPK